MIFSCRLRPLSASKKPNLERTGYDRGTKKVGLKPEFGDDSPLMYCLYVTFGGFESYGMNYCGSCVVSNNYCPDAWWEAGLAV